MRTSVEWCRWAGIKRIFYWDASASGFKGVKIGDLSVEHYQTQAEYRLAERVVRSYLITLARVTHHLAGISYLNFPKPNVVDQAAQLHKSN